MPIINRQDAAEVEQYIGRFFDAEPSSDRAQALRRLFVEKLDFAGATGTVSLANAPKTVALPPQAERIATMKGLHVVYVPLSGDGPDRVRRAEASAAAKLIADALHGDLLLVMTNPSSSQLHIIYPTFVGAAPSLRRMIIERDLPRRTAVEQLSKIYWNWRDSRSISSAVEKAFDVEAVTKEFFEEYKRVFERALATVQGFGPSEEEQEAKKLFVQTLFNRLMFIYFLSRKGWLKFNGDPDYLNALWKDYRSQQPAEKNFYVNRLEVLFFTALNNPHTRDLSKGASPLTGDVPFLNGGLFDKTEEDERADVVVPDEAIDQILRELFDKFNFTVMESTPFDQEVAVDPEMLGKVFEKLVTGRHESGSYYTPRPVVAFMCREALKGYLETQNTGASAEAIASFVDHKDSGGLTLSSAPKLGEALARVKVVDPACGSGAYLLGMMQELVELMTTLYSAQLSHEAQDLYNLKLRIIEQNLYGADIDQFAVNIAMLRLWLSLAIEYDGPVDRLPPLPNLDFKIVCGDSLLGPDPSPENYGDLFRHRIHQLAGQLADLKARHMGATGQEKTTLTTEIEGLKAKLREALADSAAPAGAVDWRVEFAEVFDQNGGFDVAIANPPYGIEADIRRRTLAGINDSYPCFMLLALELAPTGMMAFITPTSWETGEGFTTFRKRLFKSAAVQVVVNLPYDVFAAAYVDTAVTIAAVNSVRNNPLQLATLGKRTGLNLDAISSYLETTNWASIDNDPFQRIPTTTISAQVLPLLSEKTVPLQNIVESKRGIEAYLYEFYHAQSVGTFPFFTGAVYRYFVSSFEAGTFVTVGPKDLRFHTNPRILVRRLVSRDNRIMAARTSEAFVCKKDLYCLILKEQQPFRPSTLLGILNSSMISFLYLSRSAAATKDDFRQITLNGLRELPIATAFSDSHQDEIESLVNVIEDNPNSEDALRADQELDQIAFDAYGVSSKDRGRIIEWLARPG